MTCWNCRGDCDDAPPPPPSIAPAVGELSRAIKDKPLHALAAIAAGVIVCYGIFSLSSSYSVSQNETDDDGAANESDFHNAAPALTHNTGAPGYRRRGAPIPDDDNIVREVNKHAA